MRVLSWNLLGVFPQKPYDEKIREQVEFIDAIEPSPDIVFLQEVSATRPDHWRE